MFLFLEGQFHKKRKKGFSLLIKIKPVNVRQHCLRLKKQGIIFCKNEFVKNPRVFFVQTVQKSNHPVKLIFTGTGLFPEKNHPISFPQK